MTLIANNALLMNKTVRTFTKGLIFPDGGSMFLIVKMITVKQRYECSELAFVQSLQNHIQCFEWSDTGFNSRAAIPE